MTVAISFCLAPVRWTTELPIHVVFPLMSAAIVYWMVGYQNYSANFWWFALSLVLIDNCGASLGIMVSCLFDDLAVALTVMPVRRPIGTSFCRKVGTYNHL